MSILNNEKRRQTKRNLSELLSDTTDVIVANVVKPLFIFALNRLALAENDSVWSHDTEVARIGLDNLSMSPS